MINKLIIDSTNAMTDLCKLGAQYPTDKSPYSVGSVSGHRHPYTAVYDFLFSSLRDKVINFGEIGIESNYSMMCWRKYFSKAMIWGWEYYQEKIEKALRDGLPNTKYLPMNVTSIESIEQGFGKANAVFDIIIDDSTHSFDDQMRILSVVHKYLKPGGYFVIEDVFRKTPQDQYEQAIAPYMKHYSMVTFIDAEHQNKYSGDWNNDTLLVFVRGEE